METFGERLQQARKKKKLTQLELSKKVGMSSQRAVSMWENNNAKPEIDTLIQVAILLEVSVDWLLTGVNPNTNPDGKISINIEDYIEYMKLKTEKLQRENASLKNPKYVPI
ncbi:helix-turn-helix domain-containing protein [Aquirufa nivalisilvae]